MIHQNRPISLILTPFDYFQIRPTFAVTPNLILQPCLRCFDKYKYLYQRHMSVNTLTVKFLLCYIQLDVCSPIPRQTYETEVDLGAAEIGSAFI